MKKLITFIALAFVALCLVGDLSAQNIAIRQANRKVSSEFADSQAVLVSRTIQAHSVIAYNATGGDIYLMVFDQTAAPVNGIPPVQATVKIPTGKTGGYDWGSAGCPFDIGLAVAASSTPETLTLVPGAAIFSAVYTLK